MQLQIYNSEKYNRSNLRYVLFGLVTAGTLTASIFYKNRAGTILLFFLLGGYFYYSVKNSGPTTMQILEGGIQIDRKIFPWSSMLGFVMEFDTHTEKIKNIVLVTTNSYTIHTIDDDDNKLKAFINKLSEYTPMLEKYEQSSRERILRKLKI